MGRMGGNSRSDASIRHAVRGGSKSSSMITVSPPSPSTSVCRTNGRFSSMMSRIASGSRENTPLPEARSMAFFHPCVPFE